MPRTDCTFHSAMERACARQKQSRQIGRYTLIVIRSAAITFRGHSSCGAIAHTRNRCVKMEIERNGFVRSEKARGRKEEEVMEEEGIKEGNPAAFARVTETRNYRSAVAVAAAGRAKLAPSRLANIFFASAKDIRIDFLRDVYICIAIKQITCLSG